jgi:UDP-2,3-diacylglucosamine hydrolase
VASPSNGAQSVIGLIAGNGDFPELVAGAARKLGLRVVAVAFPEETKKTLPRQVAELYWVSLGQLGKIIRVFKQAGVQRVYMAGQIRHKRLFAGLKLDWKAVTLLARLRDKRADSILKAVAEALGREGLRLESPLDILKEHLSAPGVLTRRKPRPEEKKDIAFGYRIAKHIAAADIGQTVVVKNQAILAVEAMEGTDACILRGGRFARNGAVVVKVTKPEQDLRFDMPVIGLRTIRSLRQAQATVLAFDAAATLLIGKDAIISEADRSGISLVAM